eukprot:Plantae.Rhodophyta-Hildenbrandia_rubra.ctg1851.p1 GENE.Plantae.Rhodophyta-Hildenbrandia_rubra.ctg1851~~Plantae.Rhodophyta-Hildenbrandia_rubra.ctg1851.p1  ORF type:complete len:526 (+),score=98.81 Plantae.Rhodophyta-Hildenbrandia_rubra.ctg1851:133-1710(+)
MGDAAEGCCSSDEEFHDAASTFLEENDDDVDGEGVVGRDQEDGDRRMMMMMSGERYGRRGLMNEKDLVVVPRKYCERRVIGYGEGMTEAEGISLTRIAKELLSNVKAGADVTNVQLPACILDPVSSLEKGLKAMQRGEILQDVAKADTSLKRMWQILRFFLSGLSKETFGKKPYNPILGEVFRGCFKHRNDGGYTVMVAEQVSHHPPVTALHFNNPTLGFYMTSFNAPEPRFWGNSLEIKLNGRIDIQLANFGEEYQITRPTLYMSGFVAGKQRLEFVGPVTIDCPKSDYMIELEFKAKGMLGFRGEIHAIQGKLVKRSTKATLYSIQGAWDKKVTVKSSATNEKQLIFDYESTRVTHGMDCILPPAEEREDTNSLNVWRECSKALWAGDTSAAGDAKRKVEEAQRQARKEREALGVKHGPRYFKRKEQGDGYEVKREVHEQLHPPEPDHSTCCDEKFVEEQNGMSSGTSHGSASMNGTANGHTPPERQLNGKKSKGKKRREGPRLKLGLDSLSLRSRRKGSGNS